MNNNGIMYPITVPPNTIPDSEVIVCDGFAGGDGDCLLAVQLRGNIGEGEQDRFLRRNNLPPSLVPRGWIAWEPQFRRGGRTRWYYSCPACNSQIREEDMEFIDTNHQSQYPDEAGTGRAGLIEGPMGHHQPQQESHIEYLNRVNRELLDDYINQLQDFRRQQGRAPNTVEIGAIMEAIGIDEFYEDINQDKMRIIEILRKLNIPFPPQNQQRDLDYIETLINLIPEDYPENKQESTKEELKEEAKKLFKNHPEHLRLVLEQIDNDGEKTRAHDAILREMRNKYYKDKKGKKRTRDDKDGDGSGKDPRKKSKRGGRRTRRKKRTRKRRGGLKKKFFDKYKKDAQTLLENIKPDDEKVIRKNDILIQLEKLDRENFDKFISIINKNIKDILNTPLSVGKFKQKGGAPTTRSSTDPLLRCNICFDELQINRNLPENAEQCNNQQCDKWFHTDCINTLIQTRIEQGNINTFNCPFNCGGMFNRNIQEFDQFEQEDDINNIDEWIQHLQQQQQQQNLRDNIDRITSAVYTCLIIVAILIQIRSVYNRGDVSEADVYLFFNILFPRLLVGMQPDTVVGVRNFILRILAWFERMTEADLRDFLATVAFLGGGRRKKRTRKKRRKKKTKKRRIKKKKKTKRRR